MPPTFSNQGFLLTGYTYERLDGSVRGEERYLAVNNFNESDATFIFLLSTRAGKSSSQQATNAFLCFFFCLVFT